MMRLLSLTFLCLTLSLNATVQADVIIEARVVPEEAYLGQRVLLQIDVLGSEGWTKLQRLPQVDVPGAYVVSTNTQGSRLQKSVQGVSYTGQRYEFSIYTQREGNLVVPNLEVVTETSSWGPNAAESTESVTTDSLTIVSLLPPGAEGLPWLVSTPSMTVRQDWTAGKEIYEVGDSITRTVVLEAANLPGMAFPKLSLSAPEGIRAYPHEPTTEDYLDRGTQRGKRIDSATYIVEKSGDYLLPDLELYWWNLQSKELIREVLPGMRVSVNEPVLPAEASVPAKRMNSKTLLAFGGLIGILCILIFSLRGIIRDFFISCHTRWLDSEQSRFGRIGKAARRNDSRAVLRETMAWLDSIHDGSQPARLDEFLGKYRPGTKLGNMESKEMYSMLKEARGNWRKAHHRGGDSKSAAPLPKLNP